MRVRCWTDRRRELRLFRMLIATLALFAVGWSESARAKDLGPLEKYIDHAEPSIEMNEDGKKFLPFSFDHAAHVTEPYLFDGTCASCHHTQSNGSAAPQPCGVCHDVGGEAGEKKLKAKAYHSKKSVGRGGGQGRDQLPRVPQVPQQGGQGRHREGRKIAVQVCGMPSEAGEEVRGLRS